MSLNLVVNRDTPHGFWMLDEISPYPDHSGYNLSATSTSTDRATSLCKGASRSLVVDNTTKISYQTPIFKQGKEHLSFSVEIFTRPVLIDSTNSSPQQIFGNDGVYDGLVLEGTKVSFVTKYTNTGEARVTFDAQFPQSMAITAIHTKAKNSLFVNGELVGEVDITEAQQADTYVSAGTSLVTGTSAGPNRLMVNGVSTYEFAIDEESIYTHYANAQDTLGSEDVAIDYRGSLLEFHADHFAPVLQVEFESDEEWSIGSRVDVSINDGTLYPSVINGLSVSGMWQTVIPLENPVAPTLHSANLMWEGIGVVVETSLDGTTWAVAENGKKLSTITSGTTSDKFLYIRASFAGGVSGDTSFIDSLVLNVYAATLPNFDGRTVTMTGCSLEDDFDVIDYHENWGLELTNGTLTIGATPSGAVAPKTIEIWFMQTGASFSTNLSTTADAVYSNGGAAATVRKGEWQMRHYTFSAGFSGSISITGTGQLGHVILYPELLSSATIKEIYDSYTGKPKISLAVEEVFDVHEIPNSVDIYEYDWAIESAG